MMFRAFFERGGSHSGGDGAGGTKNQTDSDGPSAGLPQGRDSEADAQAQASDTDRHRAKDIFDDQTLSQLFAHAMPDATADADEERQDTPADRIARAAREAGAPQEAAASLLLMIARTQKEAGQTDLAISNYRLVLKLVPDPAAAFELAELLLPRGETEEAIALLRGAIADGTTENRAWLRLARALGAENRAAEALEIAADGHARFPQWAMMTLEYAAALHRVHRTQEAIAVLEGMLDHPRLGNGARIQLARIYFDTQRLEKVLDITAQVLERDPKHDGAAVLRFKALEKMHGPRTAVERLEEFLEGSADKSALVQAYGLGFKWLGEDGRIQDAYRLAQGLLNEPSLIAGKPGMSLLIARVALAAGDTESARRLALQAVYRLTPENMIAGLQRVLPDLLIDNPTPAKLDRILAALDSHPEVARAAQNRLSLESGDFDGYLKTTLGAESPGPKSAQELMSAFFTLTNQGEYEQAKELLKNYSGYDSFTDEQLQGVLEGSSLVNDDRLRAMLASRILVRMEHSNETDLVEILQFYVALSEGGVDEAVERILHLADEMKLTEKLVFFLLSYSDAIRAAITNAGTGHRFDCLLEKIATISDRRSNRVMLEIQRDMAQKLSRALGPTPDCLVTLLIPVHREQDLENIRQNVLRQTYSNMEVIVLPNGPLADGRKTQEVLGSMRSTRIVPVAHGTIGHILNSGMALAKGKYILRMDSDDTYLRNHVVNTVRILEGTKVDLVYKKSHFVHFEKIGRVYLISSGKYFDEGLGGTGGTQGFRTDIRERYQYCETVERSEDIIFAEKIMRDGGTVIAGDPFDYIMNRKADKSQHTWHASDFHLFGEPVLIGTSEDIMGLSKDVI
ncbi:glycosyltransferase [Halovulum dunhuangense]|uniref:Glycosyltransferase n=1 Tax=Halovulum dunhuangense TaxID=1505036 RepID=A0A849L6J7_9RHOB|nr:glycosyltransferase [Halovulum dunhuangense]NNU81740.1 glycosyltransferase [Halovulum dunhuangense]